MVQALCTLLFFVAVVSPNDIFSSNTPQSVLILTLGRFHFPASLLRIITLLLPTLQ